MREPIIKSPSQWPGTSRLSISGSRIMGIMNLIEENYENVDEMLFWIKQMRVSTNEMDGVLKKIIDEAQQLK
ncbi:MAG: hypothetical protein JJU41_10660 [Bacteroidetes bacterium]|nr:hypothetical protein [Bacteroidota bacterium]